MINMVMFIGRIVSPIEEIKLDENANSYKVNIGIQNPDKTTTNVDCILKGNIGMNSKEYLKVGDLVGVRGRLYSIDVEDKNGINILADTITFLSSKNLTKNSPDIER